MYFHECKLEELTSLTSFGIRIIFDISNLQWKIEKVKKEYKT